MKEKCPKGKRGGEKMKHELTEADKRAMTPQLMRRGWYLCARGYALYHGLNYSTVRRAVNEGRLPSQQYGNLHIIEKDAIMQSSQKRKWNLKGLDI